MSIDLSPGPDADRPARGRQRKHPVSLSRRVFLGSSLAALAAACATPFIPAKSRRRFTGSIVGGNSSLGHAFRDRQFPPPSDTAEAGIIIVGGGIGGLAAARRLSRSGFGDFLLLESGGAPRRQRHQRPKQHFRFPVGSSLRADCLH